jgi:spermidine synthase
LNSGGVVAQWVPLYETNEEAVNSQIATFMQSFPDGTIWSNDSAGEGYDILLLGQAGATRIDVAALEARLDREDHRLVKQSLAEVELGSALALMETYAGQGRDLQQWLDASNINRDQNLRLQYLAGLSPNSYLSDAIYESIVRYRRYPENLMVASGSIDEDLKRFFDPVRPQ